MSVDPKAILERIESIYGPLAEGVPTVAYVYEPGVNGRCRYISPSIERVLGYSQEEWISDGGLWDRLLHPEDADRALAGDSRVLPRRGPLQADQRQPRPRGRRRGAPRGGRARPAHAPPGGHGGALRRGRVHGAVRVDRGRARGGGRGGPA